MLVYHPALDPYHTALRLIAILKRLQGTPVEIDKARIIDFYLLFPSLIRQVSLPRRLQALRKAIGSRSDSFEYVTSPRQLYLQLRGISDTTYRALAGQDVVSHANFERGFLTFGDEKLPEAVEGVANSLLAREQGLAATICDTLGQIPLLGSSGLKARTGLAEYRYDVA